MSYLNRQSQLKSGSSSNMFSSYDDRQKKAPSSQKSGALMQSLDDFRQGLRQQISDKLKVSINKSVESPSPRKNQSPKNRLESFTGVRQQSSPSRGKNLFNERFAFSSTTSTRSSDKKPGFLKDLHKKIEERSPQKKSPSKDFTLLQSLEKRFNAPNNYISPKYRSSIGTKNKSPAKEYTSTFEERSSYSTKNYPTKSSYLYDRVNTLASSNSYGAKDNLYKILDRSGGSRRNNELLYRSESDKSRSALSQAFGQLRSSRLVSGGQSPERKDINITPRRYGSEAFRSLGSQISETFKSTNEDSYNRRHASLFNGSSSDAKPGLSISTAKESEKSGLENKLPLTKLYELQDLFYNIQDKDFNTLSPEYVEQLIKLSSVIMQRVKESTYYKTE